MGGKSGNNQQLTQTATTTQTPQVPGFLEDFFRQGAGVAGGALGSLQGLSNGPLVAGFNPDQQNAFDQFRGLAGGEGGLLPTALGALQNTARGDFLFGGQGFDQAVQAAVNAAQPGILSAFGGAGRGTGGLAQAAIGQAATDAFARQFGQERTNQLNAARSLPSLAAFGPGLLSQIGGQQQSQAQRELSAPLAAQQDLFGLASSLPFGGLIGQSQTSTSSQPLFQNNLAGTIGTGLAGLGAGLGLFNGLSGLFDSGAGPFNTVTRDAAGNIL